MQHFGALLAMLSHKWRQRQKVFLFSFFLILFLPLLIFGHNLKATLSNCFNASDLGIYAQALYDLAATSSWNPYVTVRGIHIFNDHFDPIIVLMSPWTKLTSYHIGGVLFLEMLWFYACLAVVLWIFAKRMKETGQDLSRETLYALALILGCKGILVALTFPIHPTTWAMLPCLLLVGAIVRNQLGALLLASFFVCLFKEDFPFGVFGLSFAYLLRREGKKFLALLLLSLLLLWVDFGLRPQLLGPTYTHGNHLFKAFLANPPQALWEALKQIKWGTLTLFYPFVIPLVALWAKEIRSFKAFLHHPLFPSLCFLAPLLAIRLLAQAFHFHYSAPVLMVLLGVLFHSSLWSDLRAWPRLSTLALLLFFASSSSSYTKMVRFGLFNKSSKCLVSAEKDQATRRLQGHLEQVGPSETLLSTGGILPQILRPNRLFYHVGGLSPKLPVYDYLLLEVNRSGDSWPLVPEQVAQLAVQCRPLADRILQDDGHYLFMKGKFPRSCIKNVDDI